MPIRPSAQFITLCVAAASLAGCVVAPPRQRVVYAAPPVEVQEQPVYVEVAPPQPQVEVIGVAPPGSFWVSGIWLWQGGRHVWHPGHWEAHRPGYRWTPHQWVPSGHGWQLRGGFWARG